MNWNKGLKKIVIINQDSGYLMIDIANALSNKNLNPYLIAGRIVFRNTVLADSVKVRKIIKYRRNNKFLRLLSWITAFFQIAFIIKTRHRRDYLLIVSNPPFTTFLPLICRNRFSLIIFDVFPDTLTQMKILPENSMLVRNWKKANQKVFSRADNIFTLTDDMASRIKKNSKVEKVDIMRFWSDNEFFRPIKKSLNPFVTEHSLANKFVILYSGNLGATHNVEIITELAASVEKSDIMFVIVGEGDRRKWLDGDIRKRGLKNCLTLPFQPVERMPYSFASADLGIITLGTMASGLSLPSKTYNYISAGLPLLCIASFDSELNRLVTKYNNGKCFTPDMVNDIVGFIKEIAEKPALRDLYRCNSLKASFDFTAKNSESVAEAVCNVI